MIIFSISNPYVCERVKLSIQRNLSDVRGKSIFVSSTNHPQKQHHIH